jgi:hypothetical protein
MSHQLLELETVLTQLVVEHKTMLLLIERQQAAMRGLRTSEMEEIQQRQEIARRRLANLENRRRTLTGELAKLYRLSGEVTVGRLAEIFPQRSVALMNLRDDLRGLISQIAQRLAVSSKVAGAMVGHLNTVIRLVAGAVERAGIYTRRGLPQVSRRIGVMEAVG